MGQYYTIINLDKKELLYPHMFGDGMKLMEMGCSSHGTLCALAILLADGNGRGGGDFDAEKSKYANLVGSWAGDRIVIAGDYGDDGKFGAPKDQNIHSFANDTFTDISDKVVILMSNDSDLKESLAQNYHIYLLSAEAKTALGKTP